MKEAGVSELSLGAILGLLGSCESEKSFTVQDVIRTSQLCSASGVNHCHYLLFGGPGEMKRPLPSLFNDGSTRSNGCYCHVGIRVYPGTEMEQISLSQGVIDEDADLIYPHFYISPALRGRLEDVIREKAMERKRWIVPGLEINITQNLMEGIRRFGIRDRYGNSWEDEETRVRPLREPQE